MPKGSDERPDVSRAHVPGGGSAAGARGTILARSGVIGMPVATEEATMSELDRGSVPGVADESVSGGAGISHRGGATAAWPRRSGGTPAEVVAVLGGAGTTAGVYWGLSRLRPRLRPQSRSERLTQGARALGAASVVAGTRAVERANEVAAPAGAKAVEAARRGAHTGAEATHRAAAAATPVVLSAAELATREGRRAGALAAQGASELAVRTSEVTSRAGEVTAKAAQSGQHVAATLAEVPGTVAETVVETLSDTTEHLGRSWRRFTFRVVLVGAAGTGYVLGARAGRERYDSLVRVARDLAGRPEVQRAVTTVQGSTGSAGRATTSAPRTAAESRPPMGLG